MKFRSRLFGCRSRQQGRSAGDDIHPAGAIMACERRCCDLDGSSPPDSSSGGVVSLARQRAIRLVSASSNFDGFILASILLNSILLACVDYRVVDDEYQPSSDLSTRNNVIEKCETIFTIIFATECILKIFAFGLARGKHAYLRDGWNVLDFVIVVISILGSVPGVPSFSVLRSFRVLRPLRSLSRFSSLRKIATALIESISDLANVGMLLLFMLAFFTLFGVTFWRGLFHTRCRLTPFPVRMPDSGDCAAVTEPCWQQFLLDAVSDPAAHRCLPYPNDDETWTQSTSPWLSSGPQDCFWPMDETDLRVCSANTGHTCSKPAILLGKMVSRTCGSNYDTFGNPRFVDSLKPYGFPRMADAIFNEIFDWGYTNFDSFSASFIAVFQIVTLEGWSEIMVRVMDVWPKAPSILVFSLLSVLGGIISMNIFLAVIGSTLDKIEHELSEEVKVEPAQISTTAKPPAGESALRSMLLEIVGSREYPRFILCVIVFNTIILSCDHYGISPGFQMYLDAGGVFATTAFLIDMILLNICYGARAYWSTPSTCFDGVIAVSSVCELFLTSNNGNSGKSVVSVFRSLRLVRLLKMVKQWKSLHSLLHTMGQAASDVRGGGILLFLFVFIYALFGMQCFSNRLHFEKLSGIHIDISDPKYASAEVPRSNFDDFFWAMTTVFQVLSGENWNSVMYDCWKATSAAPAYFISLMVLGKFCFLNLFLAILLRPFDGSDFVTSNRIYPEGEAIKKDQSGSFMQQQGSGALHWPTSRVQLPEYEYIRNRYDLIRRKCEQFFADKRFEIGVTCMIIASSVTLALDDPLGNPKSTMAQVLLVTNYIFATVFLAEFLVKVIAQGPQKFIEDGWNFLDLTTVLSSILELSNVKGSKTLRVIRAFRVLRPLKMIKKFPAVKIVVDALILCLPSVVDVCVVCGLFFMVFSIFGVTFLKGTFYKCVETSLSPEKLNLITHPRLVGGLSATEFSWFRVESASCGAKTWDAEKLPTSRELCDCLGAWVETIPQNFDNVLRGFALLFEISTTESWINVMYAAIDQRGVDMQPVRDNDRLWALYFILFIILGAYFMVSLFVGVVIENFSRLHEIKGQGLMTEAQRQWAATQQFVMKIRPEVLLRRPSTKLRAICYDIIMPGINPSFDRFIVAIIIANSISIGMASFGDSDAKSTVLGLLNLIFSSIFLAEATLKIIAHGKAYFRSYWNLFDFTVVCGLITGFILKASINNHRLAASISSIISLIRIGRLIRLIRLVRQLRATLNTMLSILPGFINIGALLLLLFFVYAVCGVQLYGTIAFQGKLNDQANFRSVGNAMLLLLRFMTGEDWNSFMHGLMAERDIPCDFNPVYDETSPWCLHESHYPNCREINGCEADASAYAYFFSFIIIVSFVILNMFVAVVLQAFEESNEGELLAPAELDHFISVWSEFDPDASWFINASDVQRFLSRLRPPLGVAGRAHTENEGLYIKDPCLLEISVNYKKQVNIVNVATHLAKRLAKEKQGDLFRELNDGHPLKNLLTKKNSLEGPTGTLGDMYLHEMNIILRAIRRFKTRRHCARLRSDFEHSGHHNSLGP